MPGNTSNPVPISVKSSEAHKAAVIGDTPGYPFKDTAGPLLYVLIRLLATLVLGLAPLFIKKIFFSLFYLRSTMRIAIAASSENTYDLGNRGGCSKQICIL